MSGRIKNPNTSGRVLAYFRENANVDIPNIEIKNALGLEESTVSNAIVHLRSKGIRVDRISRGIYRYSPSAADVKPDPEPELPTQKLYEFIGNSGGVTIVKGEDDELYVVTPLVEFITRQ
jgi:biotin operon repressor